ARHPRKALIVITDGEDNSSRYTFSEVRELVKELDVQIYCILQEGFYGCGYGRPLMESLVKLTGGRCFVAYSLDNLDAYVGQIHSELRSQYLLGYYPSNGNPDGHWRKIKIQGERPPGWRKLKIRAREGYYAPQQ